MSPRTVGSVLLSFLLTCPLSQAQQSAKTESPQVPLVRSIRREVLVDLVVRDKHHRLITNLRPDEIQVYEDGVAQKTNSFRSVEGAEELATERNADAKPPIPGSHTGGPAGRVTSLRETNFVTIVLADIAPLNIEFARESIVDFLTSDNLPNTYVSVYRLNRTLQVVQVYTAKKELLLNAVDRATRGTHGGDTLGVSAKVVSGSYASLQALANNVLNSPTVDQSTANAVRNAQMNPFPSIARDPNFARSASSEDVSVTLGNALLAQARIENGIRFASNISGGMDAVDALREIVRSQENLPGRKVVLYLSDGLEFPMNRPDAVANLISYANRSGVAFYAVDTRGLNVEDPMMRSLSELERTGAVSTSQRTDPVNGHKQDDDVQLTAVSNRQLPLRELAEATGGFAVTDTNEIALPMQRVMEDIRFHYELTYTPSATSYDGHFRKIEVKVARKNTQIQSRKGYFALPDLNGYPLQPYEAEALSAMDVHGSADVFPYQIAVMRFRPHQDAVEHQVAFEVPVSDFRAASGPKPGTSRIKAALVAIIRNTKGEVVGKISREVQREVPSAPDSSRTTERILYAEPIELPGGHYEMDSAVTDEESGRTSVKRLAFFVDSGKDFGLSSLELMRPAHVSIGATEENNIAVDPAHMLPLLSDSLAPGRPVDLYFVVYPIRLGSGEEPKVVLQLLHNGREVARRPLKLPQPDPDGSVPIMLRIAPTPGQCDILVTAQQGTEVAQSSLSVKVE